MNRKKFLSYTGAAIVAAGGVGYLLSDKTNYTRIKIPNEPTNNKLQPDEREILYLASLAPSGHNTQPWLVKYIEPYHWIIANDKTKWLPAVDPTQRETILSIGAFLQNLEYAAANAGYSCQFSLLATNNQDENVMEVRLTKAATVAKYDVQKIKQRRTVRSNYLSERFKTEDILHLTNEENEFIQFIDNTTKEHLWLNEQTIAANRIQAYRDDAQKELSEWIRFSGKDAKKYCDGLTTASMELEGFPAWLLRNFYGEANVMKKGFREKGIDKVKQQVSQSAGWLVITSKDNSVTSLLETGKRMQRLFLKVRDKSIALHPMTQILEEPQTQQQVNTSLGITNSIQFLLRTGYLKNYPEPVSLRRPIEKIIKFQS
jgi:hypothetical protein